MVAEDFPLHIERAGRFALRQSHSLVIVLPVLHHVEGNGDALAVGLLVGILQAKERIRQLQDAMFDATFLLIYIYPDVSIAERCTVVEHGGMRSIELDVLHVDELLAEGRQTAIVLGEEQEVGFRLIVFPRHGELEAVLSRRQLLPRPQRQLFAGGEGALQGRLLLRLVPLKRIEAVRALHLQQLAVGIGDAEGGSQRIFLAQLGGQILGEIIRPLRGGEGACLALRLAVVAGYGGSKREVSHRTEVILFILRQQRYGDGEASFGIQLHGVGRQRTGLPTPDAIAARQGVSQG